MKTDEFIEILKQIINEFRILNEHFDNINMSTAREYDSVFSNWTNDMNKRFKNIPLSMHWATSSSQIINNQLLLDIRYTDEYFCEIKYKFVENFVRSFPDLIKKYLIQFLDVANYFFSFNDSYIIDVYPKTADYEIFFKKWKKDVNESAPDITLDFHWANKIESIKLNPLFLNVMFQDDCLFEVKYIFGLKGSERE